MYVAPGFINKNLNSSMFIWSSNHFIKESIRLIMLRHYMINKYFMEMTGYYDRNGKLCTLVTETGKTFMVDKSPLEIIKVNIMCAGYDLRGAMETAKKLLGNIYHCPILVNPIDRIVLFPTLSPKHTECVWYNPVHIKRTSSLNHQTFIMCSNGKTKLIRAKLSSFNCKIKRAEQLEAMTRVTSFFILNKRSDSVLNNKMLEFYYT